MSFKTLLKIDFLELFFGGRKVREAIPLVMYEKPQCAIKDLKNVGICKYEQSQIIIESCRVLGLNKKMYFIVFSEFSRYMTAVIEEIWDLFKDTILSHKFGIIFFPESIFLAGKRNQ